MRPDMNGLVRKNLIAARSMMRAMLQAAAVLVLVISLSGCVGTAIGAGAVVGTAALEERGLEAAARDAALATRLRGKLLDYDLMTGATIAVDVGIDVYERRAMLTGIVESELLRAEAIRHAYEVEGIQEVLNEIRIGDSDILDSARDSWITTQLTTKITLDRDVAAVNYHIETVDSVVYLIGVAQSQAELDRVKGHVGTISRVRDMVSHVRVKQSTSS